MPMEWLAMMRRSRQKWSIIGMVLRGAAVGPGNRVAVEHGEVLALQQDTGGEAGIIPRQRLSCNEKAPGGGDEVGQHGDRLAVSVSVQPFADGRARAAPSSAYVNSVAVARIAGEGRAGLALPAARFEREEIVGPAGQSFRVINCRSTDEIALFVRRRC